MAFKVNRWFAATTVLGAVAGCGTDDADDSGDEVGQLAQALLPAPTAVSPAGGGTAAPLATYVWNSVTGATDYYLWVKDVTGDKIKNLKVTAGDAQCGSGGQCSFTPTTVLALGAATWWIQASNAAEGRGAWSAGLNFTVVETAGKPGKVVTISPTGNAGTNPTYTWNSITGASAATDYYLWVNDAASGGAGKIKQHYTPTQAGCAAGGVCSVTPATALAIGAATFWVQASNSFGGGDWSSARTFTVGSLTPPAAPTLSAPTGTVFTATPTYEWSASAGATQYQLWVNTPGTPGLIQTFYTPAQANCDADSLCSVTPATALTAGANKFWVFAGNAAGGAWSVERSFVYTPDVDECALNTDNCDAAATCTNTPGSFTCTCPAGQIGGGTTCRCDLSGTFAVLDELDITWDELPSPIPGFPNVFNAGSATTKSWSIRTHTVVGGTLNVSTVPCGATSPDLCSPLFNQAFSQTLPTNIWQGSTMPVGLSSMPINDPDPGDTFLGPLQASLGGLSLSNALGPWPATHNDPAITWIDHDNDTILGMTNLMKTSPPNSPTCGQPYGNLPDPQAPLGTRIDRIHVGSRLLSNYDGTLTSCNKIEGTLRGPDNGKPQVNGHVRGCRMVGGAACSAATVTDLDTQGQTASQEIVAARFKMKRVSAGILCADVRNLDFTLP
jgi:hypothetical protein